MKWKLLVLMMVCAGCATLKPGKDGSTQVEYQGTATGAAQILDSQNRRLQTQQAGDVAKAAIEKKMPTTLGQDAARSDVQAGFTYGYGGMYGMYGANMPYGASPAIMAAEAASLGYAPGALPRLGEAPVYFQPGRPVNGGSGGVQPTDSSSLEARLELVERVQKVQVRNELKRQ